MVGFANPVTIELSPDGTQLYVGVGPKLGVLEIDLVSGALTHLYTTLPPIDPTSLALSPDGNHLCAAGRFSSSVAKFSRDPVTGRLSYQGKKTNGFGGVVGLEDPRSVLVTPDGNWAVRK